MAIPECYIRQATISDMDSLICLLKALFSIEKDFIFNEQLQRQGLTLMLSDNKNRCVMVAEINGQVIGMCSIQTILSTAEGGVVGLIEDVIVRKDLRGKEIGKKLLASIENWAREKKLKRLQLLADRNNLAAIEFYEKLNWSKTQMICLRKKEF
ncbi:MAG: GNAT family N-acetyltransferase [Desulfobacterales bacterium]|nr:GNAT family N-acetyltransferase [Desulfobacterales bacterium]